MSDYEKFGADVFNKPAHPVGASPGLTIRQQAALMMAQAWLSTWGSEDGPPNLEKFSVFCVNTADAVLKREMETRGRSDG